MAGKLISTNTPVKSSWIGLNRVIRQKEGAYAGGVEIPMAVNPWLSEDDEKRGFPQILDIRCGKSKDHSVLKNTDRYHKDGLSFLKEEAEKEKPLLWAPEIILQTNETPSSIATPDTGTIQIKQLLKNYTQVCESRQDQECYSRFLRFSFRIPLQFRSFGHGGPFNTPLKGGKISYRKSFNAYSTGRNKS